MRSILLAFSFLFILSCSSSDDGGGSQVGVSNFTVTQQSDKLAFQAGYGGTADLQYFEVIAQTPTDSSTPLFTMDGYVQKTIAELSLTVGTTYSFYARAVGTNGHKSDWFGPVTLTIGSPCDAPYDVTVSNGAVYWNTQSNNTTSAYYQVQYGPQGFSLGSGTSVNTNDQSTSQVSFSQGNIYDVYVRGYCSASLGWSDWVGPVSYLADQNTNICMEPTNVGWNVEYNFFGDPVGATFHWTDNGGNNRFEYNMVNHNASPTSNALETGTSNTVTYLSVTQSTNFDFYVRTICLDGSRTSWVGPLVFNIGN